MTLNCVRNLGITNEVNIPSFKSTIAVDPSVSTEPEKSNKPVKTLLTLAALGAVTYGLFRYSNAKALKPIVENYEKSTKDGGKFTQKIFKNLVKNPNGTTEERMFKTIKSQYDKNGLKRGEVVHDYEKRECYTILFDKDGKVAKQVVRRMSQPNTNGKYFVEQSMTHSISRDGKLITTKSVLKDFSSGKASVLNESSRTNIVNNANSTVFVNPSISAISQ